jgi:hypothetical protein
MALTGETKPQAEVTDRWVVYQPLQPSTRCFNLACSNVASEGSFGVLVVARSQDLLKGLVIVGCGPCCLALQARLQQ